MYRHGCVWLTIDTTLLVSSTTSLLFHWERTKRTTAYISRIPSNPSSKFFLNKSIKYLILLTELKVCVSASKFTNMSMFCFCSRSTSCPLVVMSHSYYCECQFNNELWADYDSYKIDICDESQCINLENEFRLADHSKYELHL